MSPKGNVSHPYVKPSAVNGKPASSNRERLQEALRRRGEVAQRLEELENDWLWAQAAMERALKE